VCVVPPALYGTIKVMGLFGYSAAALKANVAVARAMAESKILRILISSSS
jgi:hypothetical protein